MFSVYWIKELGSRHFFTSQQATIQQRNKGFCDTLLGVKNKVWAPYLAPSDYCFWRWNSVRLSRQVVACALLCCELQWGCVWWFWSIEEETDRRKGKGRSCCLGYGIHSIPCLTTDLLYPQYDLKKRMNRIKATWQNGCFEKMDDHQFHTVTNHPSKMDVLPNTLAQIILAAKWFVQQSSLSPKTAATTFTFFCCLYPYTMFRRISTCWRRSSCSTSHIRRANPGSLQVNHTTI